MAPRGGNRLNGESEEGKNLGTGAGTGEDRISLKSDERPYCVANIGLEQSSWRPPAARENDLVDGRRDPYPKCLN